MSRRRTISFWSCLVLAAFIMLHACTKSEDKSGGTAATQPAPATDEHLALETVDPVVARRFRSRETGRMADVLASFNLTQMGSDPYASERRAAAAKRSIPAEPIGRRRAALASAAPEMLKAGWLNDAIEAFEELLEAVETDPELAIEERVINDLRELLALAWLRRGEVENCLERHTSDSCFIPIRDEGVHTIRTGSERAIEIYERELSRSPDKLRMRWLLNLAYMTLGQYPDDVPERWLIDPAIFASDEPFPRFRDIAMGLGLAVEGLAGGSVVEDFDADGDLDLMASSWALTDQIRYFENSGDGTFRDRTVQAGLYGIVGGLNLIHADYDNDGFADVLVLRGAWLENPSGRQPNSLLRSRGDGTFEDVTRSAGLFSQHPTQTAAWCDFDQDGWIDLFIGNESWKEETHRCELYRNNGDGTFTECASAAGVDHRGVVKGVAAGDYDNDGWPDLYISCMHGPNRLYRNLGPGTARSGAPCRFEDVTEVAGVIEPLLSFPTWFFDYDNDGWLDLFVASFEGSLEDVVADWLDMPTQGALPRLYRNQGDGTFRDVASEVGLDVVTLPMGANYGDLDNDGWLDFYLGTGSPDYRIVIPNLMFRNDGGARFLDVTTAGGFGNIQKGHGVAFADLDADGDQDIYAVIGGAYTGDFAMNTLFENPGNGHQWITLQLEGTRSNRAGIGARIRVDVETPGGDRSIFLNAGTGGSFGSSSLQQEIGLGDAVSIRRIEIDWPAPDSVQVLTDVKLNQVILVREEAGG